MTRIGLLSDTHSYVHPRCYEFFKDVDEIWHAGDIGDHATADEFSRMKPFKAVYGNIDGYDLRSLYPENLVFYCEKVKVMMTHIGGYPGRYARNIPQLLTKEAPGLFITGHSHILKIMFDKKHNLLFVNPGAAGKYGFHQSITMVRFVIDGAQVKEMEILDIPRN